ncbi:hypothetical protein CK203_055912 [Vitis vinifera]|uniref:Reverse transcriptase zinc-binding domain-containing protein n=1 Tax=Vitis vinifera TaxID=29760 RepID=A0A438FTY8_VITVI|nr:hypothetical protein CK203_055912 [Vitis vinifera]
MSWCTFELSKSHISPLCLRFPSSYEVGLDLLARGEGIFLVGGEWYQKVRFWKDKWCGTTPLCEAFPCLFALATSKEAWVNEVWTATGERGGSWSPCFTRPFNDWEMEEVERLFCCLDGKKGNVGEEDRVRWMESKDGEFSVKSLYRALQPVSLVSFPSKIIWNSCVQPKLSFFACEALWEEF